MSIVPSPGETVYCVKPQVRQHIRSACALAKRRLVKAINQPMLVDRATPVGPACFRLNYREAEADIAVLCIYVRQTQRVLTDKASKFA